LVSTAILARPEPRNAVNPETMTKVYETFPAFDAGLLLAQVGSGEAGVNTPSS
jgi:hypothetical protein